MPVDILEMEAALQADYSAGAARYRKDDEVEIQSAHHQRLAGLLSQICLSFGRQIAVLDVGCGTGRYFYCLRNVDRLVGMDLTPEMLEAARNPVHVEKLSARTIELIRGNVFLASFPPRSFDFIYTLGMFGHGCPVTVEVCNKLYSWLAPGGKLFFDTIDLGGLPLDDRIKKKVRAIVYPLLPLALQQRLDERERGKPFFGLTRQRLERVLRASHWKQFIVKSEVCESPLWQGRHLECLASKDSPHG